MVKVPKAGRGVPLSNSRASTVLRGSYFCLDRSQFDHLLQKVGARITQMDNNYRESISPVERLAICLRFLATGDSYRTIGFSFRVGRSTVAGIVPSVAQAIWDCLVGEYMPVPKEEDWRTIAAEFLERWNFPNCLGSIDGKHVVIQAPPCSGSQFYNYKDTYSVVLLAVVDAIYCFRVVDVRAYGKGSDGVTLRDCLWPGTSGWHPGYSTTCITPWG
ncbi:uncharacterized protein LOC116358145 [Oncorhynchus kisutch]|uniref:uncharacterized protein LOC116358145 n=1 Tax=Oncorhynchus kisutch TaxID=8019 RepID=UPI0012DD459A|nr:uncharacterized protein LOC116358145 [Oncorhynchus kisutch]